MSKLQYRIFWCVAFLSLGAAALSSAWGQTGFGTVTGTVLDPGGLIIPAAAIRVKNLAMNTVVQTVTSSGGIYNVSALVPGTYSVEAEMAGLERMTVSPITISASITATVDFHMRMGAVAESVVVTAEAPLLTPSTPTVATTIEHKLVQDLPYIERSSLTATLLTPGVRGDPSTAGQMGTENPIISTGFIVPTAFLMVGGAWPGRTSVLIDGSDITQTSFPRSGMTVSAEMVQETTVITNGLPAEFGRTQGGVVTQATRSGGNEWHGTGTWRHSDPSLQARQFASSTRPAMHENFFGAYFSGPVVLPKIYNGRNKTFFYAGIEPGRIKDAIMIRGRVPTADELAGRLNNSYALLDTGVLRALGADAALAAPRIGSLFYQFPVNAAGFPNGPKYSSPSQYVPIPNNDVSRQFAQNPLAKYVMSQMPTLQNPGALVSYLRPDGLWMPDGNNVIFQRGVADVDNRYSFRVDQMAGQNDRLFVRYSNEPIEATRFFGLPPDSPLTQVPRDNSWAQDVAVTETHILTPSVVNSFRVMYMRNRQLRTETQGALSKDWAGSFGLTPANSGAGFPALNISTPVGYSFNPGNGGGSSQVDENYQVADDVTWIKGSHSLKFGMDVRALQSNQYNLGGVYGGSYVFDGAATGNGTAGGASLAAFDLGLVSSFSNTPTPVPAYYRWKYYAGYVQDDWKLRSNLTLHLGMRYEVETPRAEKYNNQGSFIPGLKGSLNGKEAVGAFCFSGACGLPTTLWPTNYKGFEPRVGIAWSPAPFMSARMSYGLTRVPLTGYGNTPNPDFNVASFAIGGINGGVRPNEAVDLITNPVGPLSSAVDALRGTGPFFTVQGVSVPYVDQSTATPYSQQWSASLQFQLRANTMVQVSYNGMKTTHLISRFGPAQNYPDIARLKTLIAQKFNFTATQANPFGIAQGGASILENAYQATLPYQNFFNQTAGIPEIFNRAGNSNYNALYVSLNHRYHNGLSLLSSFTWSKSIDDVGGDQNSANSVIGATQVQDPQNQRAHRSVSNFDIPVTFTAGYTYELPFGHNKILSTRNKVLDMVLGDWVTAGIYNVQAGYPFWVAQGSAGYWFSEGGGNVVPAGVNLRPNVVQGQSCISPDWRTDPINRPYVNSAYFSVPGSLGAPEFGNAPATLTNCRSPRIQSLDMNLHKKILLGSEKRYLQIGLNASNALNHPQFMLNLNLGHNLSNAYNGATAATPFAVQSNFGFLGVGNAPPRIVQLSAKLFW